MSEKKAAALRGMSPYSAVITREQFLFYETRSTAKLLDAGLSREEATYRIIKDNLFQYPTNRMLKRMALCCIQRLEGLNDETLVRQIATGAFDTAKQICLYAMMRQYRLVAEFMMTIIGEKYRMRDFSFGRIDVNAFFMRLQEQDDAVATWSDATIAKCKQVLLKLLVENEYLDNTKSERLNPVLLCSVLENAILGNGDKAFLPAFNYFL